jgi:SAM-dependent methyltransferase
MTHTFPAEYDHDIYLGNYPDLQKAGFDRHGLKQHYVNHGISEGRSANEIKSRKQFAAIIPKSGTILELSPEFCPIITEKHAKYFGTESREALIAKAKSLNAQATLIPAIDFISPNRDLSIINEQFDAIVSSHNIGRYPNLIGHLNQVQSLLNPDGRFYCIIPDKRYCHHYYKDTTQIATVLGRHLDQVSTFSSADSINHLLQKTHCDLKRHWLGDHGNIQGNRTERLKKVLLQYKEQNDEAHPTDTGAFYFTPDSFREIMDQLYALGLTGLQIERLYRTHHLSFEFFAVLRIADEPARQA